MEIKKFYWFSYFFIYNYHILHLQKNMDTLRDLIVQIENLKQDKKFEEAIKIIESSISKYNEDYRLYEELSDIFLYKGELEKSLRAVNFALSIHEESATWNYLKWFILLSKDRPLEAIRYLEKSNSLIWNNSEVLRNLWWAYTITGESERWIILLKRALNISPSDELIVEDLAMALLWIWEIEQWNALLNTIWRKSKK